LQPARDLHRFPQVLSLPNTHLVLWEAMLLVGQLLLLSDLETDAPTFEGFTKDTIAEELSDFRRVDAEMGSRFRC
ncbi:hypothetical protein GGI08_006641, partial [Coemansia sp. S2]